MNYEFFDIFIWSICVLMNLVFVQKTSTIESENREWAEKYGPEAQKVIRQTVDENIPHYEYLKQFCIAV